MSKEIKDAVELVAVNTTGVGFSMLDIDALLRTLILLGTLVYTILKVIKYYKYLKEQKDKTK